VVLFHFSRKIYSFLNSFFKIEIFEESKENKLEYTPIFHDYTRMIEDFIETRVRDVIPVCFSVIF
jgi:hypothetical protein